MPRTKKVDANAPTTTETKSTKSTTKSTNSAKKTTTSSKKLTAAEAKAFYEQNKSLLNFASAENALRQLVDTNKSSKYRTVSNFNKENLRTYLQNISSNEKNLRNLSRYLYYRSQPYSRLIRYNANMFCLDVRSVIPNYSLTEENDKEAMKLSYNNTLQALDKMNLQYEFKKMNEVCFREDVSYNLYYFNPESEAPTSFYTIGLDPDYCKIVGVWETGDFAFKMDMSYFRKNQELVEYLGEPITSMYSQFERDGDKWQLVPAEYGLCLKANAADYETVVPVFSGMLNSVIALADQEDIQAIADEQSIYKLIWMEMETFDNGEPNDFKVDPEQVTIPYWNRMVNEALPDYTSYALVPGKLNTISFDHDQTTDVNKIEKSTQSLFNASGGSQVLNSSTASGTTAVNAMIKSDAEYAFSMLLPQIQMVVNRILSLYVDNACKVKFFPVSPYTKQEFKDSILKDNTYGLAPKLLVNAINGFSERETMALNFLESEVLNLQFTPVQSSHTTNGTDLQDGKPTLSDTEITDEGEASREKKDTAKG